MSRHNISMNTLNSVGSQIRKLREDAQMPLRKLASLLDIDQSTLSKIERDERRANIQLLEEVAKIFSVHKKSLLVNFYSDLISYEIEDEKEYSEILKVAEAKIEYKRTIKSKS